MIHAKGYQTRVIPWNSAATWEQIDRLQEITGDLNLNRDRRYELGRELKVDFKKRRPEFRYTARQLEYGNMAFWRRIANKANSALTVTQDDLKTSAIDLVTYSTDDNATVLGSIWLPNLRTANFSLNIGDPDADLERNFEFNGEHYKQFQGVNKYVIYLEKTVESGEAGSLAITIGTGDYANYPAPVVNPDVAGEYILRVLRVRAGVVAEMAITTNYTYVNATKILTFLSAQVGDVYKVIYTAGSFITGSSIFTDNDTDPGALIADSTSVYLNVSNYAHMLQSVNLEVSLDRTDYSEIGSDEIQVKGVREVTTRVSLDKYMQDHVIEEILRGVATGYGLIDAKKFAENISLVIKVYTDSTKTAFKMGYKVTNLSPTNVNDSASASEYGKRTFSLESDNILITDDESSL